MGMTVERMLPPLTEPTEVFRPKITNAMVEEACDLAASRYEAERIIVLLDGFSPIQSRCALDCRFVEPDIISDFDPARTVFVYACEQDDIGSPFIREIHRLGGRYLPVMCHEPALYSNVNTVARRSLEAEFSYQKAQGFAKWNHGPHDFLGLIQALDITKDVPGSFVEMGTFNGSSAGAALRYLGQTGRSLDCHFLDVFEGFTYPEALASADMIWSGGHVTNGHAAISARLSAYIRPGLKVSVHKANIITDDLPVEVGQIAVANLDVDLHEAVLAGLRKLAPRMAKNGVLVVEDPGHSPLLIGARAALDQFMEEGGAGLFIPVVMNSGQTFLIRR